MRSFSRSSLLVKVICAVNKYKAQNCFSLLPLTYITCRGVQTVSSDEPVTVTDNTTCSNAKRDNKLTNDSSDATTTSTASPHNTPVHRSEVYAQEFTINAKNRLHDKDGTKSEQLIHMWRDTPNGESGVDVVKKYGATFKDPRPIDPNEPIDIKRRRLMYQSRYRGMVEMDLVFGHFARCKLDSLDVEMLNEYDILLKQLDNDLFNWIVMELEPPSEIASLKCFSAVKEFVKNNREELLKVY